MSASPLNPLEAGRQAANTSIRHDLSLARTDTEEREDGMRPLKLSIILRLFRYTKPYAAKRNWLLTIAVVRAVQLLGLALIVAQTLRGPVADRDWPGIVWHAVAFFVLLVTTQLGFHYRMRWSLELGEAVVYDLRNMLFERLTRQPMAYFNRTRIGRLISRMTSDMEALRQGVQSVLFVSIVQGGQMICAAIAMAVISWRLFLVVLAMAPVLWWINAYFRTRISVASRQLQESFSRVTASIAETVKGIRVTQGFTREEVNAGIFRRLVVDHSRFNLTLTKNMALYIPLLDLNTQFFIAMLLCFGGYGVLYAPDQMGAEEALGSVVAFFFLANYFFEPILGLGRMFASAMTAMAGAERVFGVLDDPLDWEDKPDAKPLPPLQGRVEFKNVSFHYEPEKPVLKEVSLTAQPGEMVALVGHTGSGKSTIINLLTKFWLPVSGEVLLDGHNILDVTSDSLHRQMGLVLQANFLFSGTVLDNIRVGKLGATEAEVMQAIDDLGCMDLIEALPEGLQTAVGERGAGLSLGQQQVVCFARAMLADPRLLILDEATSSVDTMTEARLQDALDRLLQNRTSFVVAHRLSTIRRADQVLVLDHGVLKERGTHNELLEQGGIYSELYRKFAEQE